MHISRLARDGGTLLRTHPLRFAAGALMLAAMLGNTAPSGCFQTLSAVSGFAVTQSQLDTTRASFDAFLPVMKAYTGLPSCTAGQTFLHDGCANYGAVQQLKADKDVIITELNTVQQQISTGNNAGLTGAFTTLTNAITAAKNLIATSQGT